MSGAHDFVARHRTYLTGPSQLMMREIGRVSYLSADGWVCRASQMTLATGTGYCREQACRIIGRLYRTPVPDTGMPTLQRIGRLYIITDLDDHERFIEECRHPQCMAEVAGRWGRAGRPRLARGGRRPLQVAPTAVVPLPGGSDLGSAVRAASVSRAVRALRSVG